MNTFYDVTKWKYGNAYDDIGAVINSIIKDIKNNQGNADENSGGKPGAVIYLPPGDYHMKSQVLIDISYLRIKGSGHGFVSSSIRYNTPEETVKQFHTVWPGGSRILVEIEPYPDEPESGVAFLVHRNGEPRISSVEFSGFCIDGLHFVSDGAMKDNPENTYVNGKTGIYVKSPHDSFRINEMGFVYLEHGIVTYGSDALSIHDNFITECGNAIELRSWGQATKITDNLIGAGFNGFSIFAENYGGLLIASNNIFPRGSSSIYFSGVARSSVTGNRIHSFYPGLIILENSNENLISSNHILRDSEPWTPFLKIDNGLNDDYGLLYVEGSYNTITGNHISEVINENQIKPLGTIPVIIHIVSGIENYVAYNHIVVTMENGAGSSDSCYSAQVNALLAIAYNKQKRIALIIEKSSAQNIILDNAKESEMIVDKDKNTVRALT